MDIKLRARLSAYSKVDSITSLQSYVPVPEATNAGNILGVGNAGEYTLIGTASPSDIDNIFTPVVDNTVTKDEIDATDISISVALFSIKELARPSIQPPVPLSSAFLDINDFASGNISYVIQRTFINIILKCLSIRI